MKFIHYVNCVSPHQLPLARELVKRLGAGNYRYVVTEGFLAERADCGWSDVHEPWISYGKYGKGCPLDADLEKCQVLLTGIRELGLFETRAERGLKTFYMSERWFKPVPVGIGDWGLGIGVPGWVRMFVPSYRKMAKRFVRWIQNDPNGRVFTIGPWAKKDMLRLGVLESKIIPWGYFVAPSVQQSNNRTIEQSNNLKVLWVGRMIPLKRVDTIIRALGEVANCRYAPATCTYSLTLVGDGPEKSRLRQFANQIVKQSNHNVAIDFLPFQPLEKVREIMRVNDVFVFASNQIDGWGAVVNEALEERLVALGTKETGASATLLSSDCQFHAGDWRTLAKMLRECAEQKRRGELRGPGIGDWSAAKAAERLLCAIGE